MISWGTCQRNARPRAAATTVRARCGNLPARAACGRSCARAIHGWPGSTLFGRRHRGTDPCGPPRRGPGSRAAPVARGTGGARPFPHGRTARIARPDGTRADPGRRSRARHRSRTGRSRAPACFRTRLPRRLHRDVVRLLHRRETAEPADRSRRPDRGARRQRPRPALPGRLVRCRLDAERRHEHRGQAQALRGDPPGAQAGWPVRLPGDGRWKGACFLLPAPVGQCPGRQFPRLRRGDAIAARAEWIRR